MSLAIATYSHYMPAQASEGFSPPMYVCICNAIREDELREAARGHGGDAEALYARLGKTPQCRQCLCDAEELIEQERTCREAA